MSVVFITMENQLHVFLRKTCGHKRRNDIVCHFYGCGSKTLVEADKKTNRKNNMYIMEKGSLEITPGLPFSTEF